MTATVSTTSEPSGRLTPLAERIKADGPEDHRSCPHNCPGNLSLLNDDRVICQTCRTTPEGVYIPPKGETGVNEGRCAQFSWFCPSVEGNGHPWADDEREHYRHSGKVVLAGGFEEAYPHDMTSREGSIL